MDTVLEELNRYKNVHIEQLRGSLSLRWTIERGLMAGSTLIFDVVDHILSAVFGIYPETFESSLESLRNREVISQELYDDIKGLGGLRNILVHEYLKIDLGEIYRNLEKGLRVFSRFSQEIQRWLEFNS